jgi:alkaline phosphatase
MNTLRHFTALLLILSTAGLSCSDRGPAQEGHSPETPSQPDNIILMIGDGMGVSQIYAAMTVSNKPLAFEQFRSIGFQKTYSADHYITDSGASGTAMATGEKTNKGHIAVSPSGEKLTTILELAEAHGLSTGLVSTSSILHATPASFIAHNRERYKYAALAEDFLQTDIEVFIGGGYRYFAKREDGQDLTAQLKDKGYQVLTAMDEIQAVEKGKLAGLTAENHNPKYSEGREDMLPAATQTALQILDNNEKGFFLMVESSQIDWGGHDQDKDYIVNEMLDFNQAVEKALAFQQEHPNTLLIVTADHETGGMALTGGDIENHQVEASFPTDGHTGVMVPVFAKGPGAENFQGIYENTGIFHKMKTLYGF